MAKCRYCDGLMDWGQDAEGKWVKLVPIGQDDGLDRTHQDENGVLRAQHACVGWTPAVKVVRLAKTVPADHVLPISTATDELMCETKPRRRTGRKNRIEDDYGKVPF